MPRRLDATRNAIDTIDAAQQIGLRIGGTRKTIIRTRQIFFRHRPHDVGRYQHHQLGLAVDVIAAAEQRAQHRQLGEPRQTTDGLFGLFLDQPGHSHGAARGYFQRGFGTTGLDGRNRRSTSTAGQRVFKRNFRHFGHHSKADPSFGQYHGREVERDAEFFETDRLDALSDAAGRRRLAGPPVGIGNSPPEINVADSPEIAVRFGSASVRTTPALSIARSVAVTVGTPALFRAAAVKLLSGTSGPLFAVNGLLLL